MARSDARAKIAEFRDAGSALTGTDVSDAVNAELAAEFRREEDARLFGQQTEGMRAGELSRSFASSTANFEAIEKKRKADAEATAANFLLASMIAKIDAEIAELREVIEEDQAELEVLRHKETALQQIKELVRSGKFDPNNKDHQELLKQSGLLEQAGVDTAHEFDALPDDQKGEFLDTEIEKTNSAIEALVQGIEDNLHKLDMLVQAKKDLGDGTNPEKIKEIQERLEHLGISLVDNGIEGEKIDLIGKLKDNIALAKDDFNMSALDFEQLSPLEQVEFIKLAQKLDVMSSERVDVYRAFLSEDARSILENEANKVEPAQSKTIGPV